MNYEAERPPLPTGKVKKVTGLMKSKLGGKIMKKVGALRPRMCNYLNYGGHVKSSM